MQVFVKAVHLAHSIHFVHLAKDWYLHIPHFMLCIRFVKNLTKYVNISISYRNIVYLTYF